jgi:thymidine kinase
MFLEPHFKGQRSGWIEVICGPMFSGKTEELIRRLKRAKFANQKVLILKPVIDNRFHDRHLVSHDENTLVSTPIEDSNYLKSIEVDVEVVGIDEAQFFDTGLTAACEELALKGKRVIVAGLDMDFKGKPFGPMPYLLAVAEYITKVHAICHHCGNLATHSYRLSGQEDQIVVGEKETYEPRCRVCYSMGNILDFKAARDEAKKNETLF